VELIGVGGVWEGQSNLAHSKLDHEYRWLKCAAPLTACQKGSHRCTVTRNLKVPSLRYIQCIREFGLQMQCYVDQNS